MTNLKKLIYTAALAASALIPQSVSAADDSLDVNVPFAFVVGGRQMPAGAYVIQASKTSGVVLLRSGASAIMVSSGPGGSSPGDSKPGLTFEKKGATTYLVGVHTGELPARSVPLHSFDRAALNSLR